MALRIVDKNTAWEEKSGWLSVSTAIRAELTAVGTDVEIISA
jgi:hypothetical protein